MTTKLDWNYDSSSGEYIAACGDLRIRAVLDSCPENPFEAWDCNWPILTRCDGYEKIYDKHPSGVPIDSPLWRFNDGLIVHFQKHLTKLLDAESYEDVRYYLEGGDYPEDKDAPNWITDAEALRTWFEGALENWDSGSAKLDKLSEIYDLLRIPNYRATSRGYSQGDWTDVLVVATPEAVEKLGVDFERFRTEAKADPKIRDVPIERQDAWIWEQACRRMLKSTVDLYGAWAWGDVYGYIVEENVNKDDPAACECCGNTLNDGTDVCDQCGGDIVDPEPEWEEVEDGSCWGYYGSDFGDSGLEDAAMEIAEAHQQEKADA